MRQYEDISVPWVPSFVMRRVRRIAEREKRTPSSIIIQLLKEALKARGETD